MGEEITITLWQFVLIIILPLIINLISNYITRRYDYRRQLKSTAIQLRNILYNVEFSLNIQDYKKFTPIATIIPDQPDWNYILVRCDEIRNNLDFLLETFSLEPTLRDSVFKRNVDESNSN
jgi:hypothetical protein